MFVQLLERKEEREYEGIVLKESLLSDALIEELPAAREEVWNIAEPGSDQPEKWHAVHFRLPGKDAESFAQKLSRSLRSRGWYVSFKNGSKVWVVYPNHAEQYRRGDQKARKKLTRLGLSFGVPVSQLDWAE